MEEYEMKRKLVLEDGSVYVGEALGADQFKVAEIIFNTAMSGYQEVLSDPSYYGQMVVMSYPLIGNYGINRHDFESLDVACFGLIVNEVCEHPVHHVSSMSLDQFLKTKGIAGISGIDTRALTKKIRDVGAMRAVMANVDDDETVILEMLNSTELCNDHIAHVTCQKAYRLPNSGYRVVLVDFGVKQGIIHELCKRECDVIVVPYTYSYEAIMALEPSGIVFSNGPGDPKDALLGQALIKQLLGKVPIFGICLGHQLLCLACDANTVKLKFGHHGINQPVIDLATGLVGITSQNHSYAVDEKSLASTDLYVSHRNLNDNSIEGVAHSKYPAFSVQYHPEASPGPSDANYLFDRFMTLIKEVS